MISIASETNIASSPTGDPYLLTPGPLTTSATVKQAMLHDYGSRDSTFIEINAHILDRLVDIVNGANTHVCVPLQGSGTFVVEAMIGCFVPAESLEDIPIDTEELDRTLAENTDISHVVMVYCETTTGILNPIREISEIVARHQRGLLIDAMSAFGALPLDANEIVFDAVVASSNKCLEGSPGMGFCIARESAMQQTKGNSPSLSLDLYDQWQAMMKNKQWRFTPPTHVLLAFDQALKEFEAEGGVSGRGGRYRENGDFLISGMRAMGFKTLLPDDLQAPIIITFHMPTNPEFNFDAFYDGLRGQGYVIYPGKLTVAESFRMGCIGRLNLEQMQGALDAVKAMLQQFGIERIS